MSLLLFCLLAFSSFFLLSFLSVSSPLFSSSFLPSLPSLLHTFLTFPIFSSPSFSPSSSSYLRNLSSVFVPLFPFSPSLPFIPSLFHQLIIFPSFFLPSSLPFSFYILSFIPLSPFLPFIPSLSISVFPSLPLFVFHLSISLYVCSLLSFPFLLSVLPSRHFFVFHSCLLFSSLLVLAPFPCIQLIYAEQFFPFMRRLAMVC